MRELRSVLLNLLVTLSVWRDDRKTNPTRSSFDTLIGDEPYVEGKYDRMFVLSNIKSPCVLYNIFSFPLHFRSFYKILDLNRSPSLGYLKMSPNP